MVWTYISYAVGSILAISGALILTNIFDLALQREARIVFGSVILLYGVYRIVSTQKQLLDKKRWEK